MTDSTTMNADHGEVAADTEDTSDTEVVNDSEVAADTEDDASTAMITKVAANNNNLERA